MGDPWKTRVRKLSPARGLQVADRRGSQWNYRELSRNQERTGSEGPQVPIENRHRGRSALGGRLPLHGMSLEEAFRKTVNRLEGAYAIVLTSTEQPKTILCAREESPLVLGLGDGEYYCASDFAA